MPPTPLMLLALLWTCAGDSLSRADAYAVAARLVTAQQATREFLNLRSPEATHDAILIVDTLYTLDRFPLDSPTDGEAVSVYRADMIRPLYARYAPWLAHGHAGPVTRGILFFSIVEHGAFIAELFPVDPALRSYEQYSVTWTGMKFLFVVGEKDDVELRCYVRLER